MMMRINLVAFFDAALIYIHIHGVVRIIVIRKVIV